MKERRPIGLDERWRREAHRGVDGEQLDQALAMLPSIRNPNVRVRPGSIRTELEGAMGSINEVSIHAPTLPGRIWPQVARVLRRSATMLAALKSGKVPRSLDRLVARIAGESLFPEARRITAACTCGSPESPCRHILALHELFARRLGDRPWELLELRGVSLQDLLARASRTEPDPDLPPLAFGASEEPVLFPEGEDGDLDFALSEGQIRSLAGASPPGVFDAFRVALDQYRTADQA
ncbi:MAG: hypothetical protein AAF628_06535 [Planctomycetota bacterium]